MSEDNLLVGASLYSNGDASTRSWIERQWKIRPIRADESLTTNMSLHYGGLLAYRAEHGGDPKMSEDFRSNVEWYDRNSHNEGN